MPNVKALHATRWSAMDAVVLSVLVMACVTLSNLAAQNTASSQVKTISIPVEGMSCVSCAARVKRTLKGIEGVQHVEVSLERREATVRFTPEKVTPERLEAAINELGYKAGKSRMVESK